MIIISVKKDRLIITAITIIILDQITKLLISRFLPLNKSLPLIKNILHFTYIHNTGAGFGLFRNMNSILIWITITFLGAFIYNYSKLPKERFGRILIGLILGGAIGNLISRIFVGSVPDFIDFRIWPIFNIADSAISIGAIGLIIYYWKK